MKTKSNVQNLTGHSRSVDTTCLLENGKTLVSSGSDQSLRVWDLETGKLIRSLNQHTKPVHALAAKPAAGSLPMVASASGDRTIRFWQPTIGRMVRFVDPVEVKVTKVLPAIDGWAYAIAVNSIDSGVAVGGSNGQIQKF